MMTVAQYFGIKPHSEAQEAAALDLLGKRNALRVEWMQATGRTCPIDPDTGTELSGSRGGAGDGGFRLTTATTGKVGSSHKCLPADKPDGAGVDDFDGPDNAFDTWLDQFEVLMPDGLSEGGNTKLEEYGLYREHPDYTQAGPNGWAHLQTRAPISGKRTYKP